MATNIPTIKQAQGSLFQYISEINKIPMLTEEEETKYAKLKEKGNIDAVKILVSSHLKLVVKIAFNYKNYKLPMADLISEGNIGLMKAIKNFKLSKNCRLSTYATWWIKAYIQDYILKTWSLIKIGTTVAQKKLFFSLRKIKNKILECDANKKYLDNSNIKEIAKECNVRIEDVKEMNQRLSFNETSLNAKVSHDHDKVEILDLIEAKQDSPDDLVAMKRESEKRREVLQKGLIELEERERDILCNRKLVDNPLKLDDLSKKYKISRERVRQIEKKAIEKLKIFIQKNYCC